MHADGSRTEINHTRMTANIGNKTLFVIPARGGSKGLPRKNILPLAGKPLVMYAVDVARELAPDSMIILSTDSEDIADTVRGYGLPVPYMRPAELATDTAGSREVVLDAMRYADGQGIAYDNVCLLQPTSPLRTADDVRRCINLYRPDLDMVTTVKEVSANPYFNCFETDPESGCLRIAKGDGCLERRQDAPKAWELNGAVYVINPASIRAMPFGRMMRRMPVEMPVERSVDIDSRLDWIIAEHLLAEMKN